MPGGRLPVRRFLLKNSVTWAKGGHIPAYQPVAQSPEYLALQPQSFYRSVAADVELDPPAWFSGSGSVLETEDRRGVLLRAHRPRLRQARDWTRRSPRCRS